MHVCGISEDVEALAAMAEMIDDPGDAAEGVAVVDESILVRRARQGAAGAFEALYRANAGRVFALCLRMSGRRDVAEELAQEAFVRAWRNLGSFRGDSAFSTWLHRLTVNVVLGHHRSRIRRELRESPSDVIEAAAEAAPASEPGVAVDLERAIAGLPDGARTVFVLYDVEGYRHEEIGRLLGVAVGTSKAQLHRARRLLREALS